MPLKPHPTDPDKLVYESRRYMFKDWAGLTDEEIETLWQNTSPYYDHQDFARAIEAKLKEKNTRQDGECKYCTHGCHACDARRQSNVLS